MEYKGTAMEQGESKETLVIKEKCILTDLNETANFVHICILYVSF